MYDTLKPENVNNQTKGQKVMCTYIFTRGNAWTGMTNGNNTSDC